MLSDQRAITSNVSEVQEEEVIRDIHALTPPHPQRAHIRENNWETRSSTSEGVSSENNFTTMSREFNNLVIAGSTIANRGSNDIDANGGDGGNGSDNYAINLRRIGEEEEEVNPLAIVPDSIYMNPLEDRPEASPRRTTSTTHGVGSTSRNDLIEGVTMHQVKKEEIESKIYAWQTSKISKINNRFKREDAIIHGWEGEQVEKASSEMKKVERKLEEKRAKALEKMQNEVAKAHRKAEERRASAGAKRGTKVARVLEIANLMRTLGRPPIKRSFF
ncbi:hypothetical protein IFM89_006968 [Coptis chinensis]|uniref:Remorin C-terminal domain-containing protein n=1 Tax=Coptis chinensis TaxID=261450 RepID=A0A835HA01_9MAGN|nr:hypothetical protein IFM89_006968 [Coptis chinensis]